MTAPAAWKTELIGPSPRICVDHAGRGELVIFVHGIGGNRTNWHDQLPVFSQHYHAVACDCRGYGDSDDYDGALEFSSFADDVVRVHRHFGVKTAHIVGLSMGGRIALDLAVRFPDRVASLVLCDTHRGFAKFPEATKREFVRSRKEPLINGGQPKDIAVPVAKTLAGPTASPQTFQRLVDSLSSLHKESYIKSLEATVSGDREVDLSTIGAPSLVVVGEHDILTPPAEARTIADAIPGAKYLIIPKAGHLSNIENPEFFNDRVLHFLLQVAPGEDFAR
jgi:3-oxoadipate enol-lactonase